MNNLLDGSAVVDCKADVVDTLWLFHATVGLDQEAPDTSFSREAKTAKFRALGVTRTLTQPLFAPSQTACEKFIIFRTYEAVLAQPASR